MFVPTLFGREQVLKRLADHLAPPFLAPRVVLIEGPAGIGKTSLLWAGLAKAEELGVTTLRASPLESEVSFVYATLRDLFVGQIGRFADQIPALQRQALEQALGEGTDSSQQPASGEQVAAAVLGLLRKMISAGPTVLAVDDVGWTDQASQDALTFAVRRLAGLPLRIVLTQRRESSAGLLPLGLGDPGRPIEIERIWLEPLSMGALQAALQSATGATFSRPTLLRINEISAGNPFYAIELGRALVARGARVRPGEDLPVPSSLRGLVADRLNAMPPATRRLLLTAAMSSRPSIELLRERAGRDPRPILDAAVRAELVNLDERGLRFAHPLFASTLVAEASDGERQQTHTWLGEAAHEDAEARARHLALANSGVNEAVAKQLAQAATQANLRGAPAVAAELADLSVERSVPGSVERVERALMGAEASYAATDFSAIRTRVASLLPSIEGTQRARALLLDALATWYVGTPREASATLTQALADAGDDAALAGLIHYYGSIFGYDLETCRRHAVLSAELLHASGDRGHEGSALLQAFCLSVGAGDAPEYALLEEGLAAEAQGPLTDRLTTPGMWWAGIGRLDLARERFRQLLDLDLAHGFYSNVGNLLTRLSEVALWSDDWPQARSLAASAIEAELETGAPTTEMSKRAMALVDAHEGRLDVAEAAANEGVARCERDHAVHIAAAWLQVSALVASSRGDAAAVVAATERAAHHLLELGYRESLRLDPAPERIDALAELGRIAEAETELREFEARNRIMPKSWAAAVIARGAARIAIAREDLPAAIAATDVAVQGGEPDGWSRFDLARVLLVRGEALRRARSRRAASEVLHRAKRIFVDLGAEVWAQNADAELARLGLTRTTSLALTPTEAKVAHLAGNGMSSKEVAADLGISPRTVETHLAAIYGKLGVNSRAELGRYVASADEDAAALRGT